jgi:ABC-type transport system involved in multi-copper enzyme maturation permease subunit
MLWYKAWLETRARFLISLGGILALCSWIVFHEDKNGEPYGTLGLYYRVLQDGHVALTVWWVLAVTLLMMGGLVREKAAGASSFTLALPVSRARIMRVRIVMGLVQAMTLVVVPWGVMFLISATVGKPTSLFQAFFHVVLLAGGGLVFFAAALLVSSLVEGEYTAPAVSLGIACSAAIALSDRPFSAVSPWNFAMGTEYFDRTTGLLMGPLPWLHLTVSILLAALLIAVSIGVIERREF